MNLITLVIYLSIIGFIAWLVLQIPMPAIINNLIVGIIILFTVLFLLQQFGLNTGLPLIKLK